MKLSQILYLWAKDNPPKIQQLKNAQETCIQHLLSNQGQQSISGSQGDISFSFSSSSMTYEEWLNVLTESLQLIESQADLNFINVSSVIVDFR